MLVNPPLLRGLTGPLPSEGGAPINKLFAIKKKRTEKTFSIYFTGTVLL